MADKPYSELTATERAKFGSEEEYKNFMKSTRDTSTAILIDVDEDKIV